MKCGQEAPKPTASHSRVPVGIFGFDRPLPWDIETTETPGARVCAHGCHGPLLSW